MLWEVIKSTDAKILSPQDVLQQLRQTPSVLLFPESLPSLYLGADPAYTIASTPTIIEKAWSWLNNSLGQGISAFEIEPLYVVSCDYSWMIVLTTENTRSGDQLCVLMRRVNRYA